MIDVIVVDEVADPAEIPELIMLKMPRNPLVTMCTHLIALNRDLDCASTGR